jgi:hypothetical protein
VTPIFFFIFHLPSWVKIRLHTENKLPMLPGSVLKVPGGVGSYPLSSLAPTHVEVELGCDNFYEQGFGSCDQMARNTQIYFINLYTVIHQHRDSLSLIF